MTSPHSSPTASLGRLNRILRQLREHDGRTQPQVANALGWSTQKVGNLENGNATKPQVSVVNQLLDAYGDLVGSAHRELILNLVRQSRERGWWWQYRDVLTDTYATYIGTEYGAEVVRNYEPLFIPGMLQTESYARALIAGLAPDMAADVVDRLITVRALRQQRLTAAEAPVTLFAIIGEAALRSCVGDAQVMADQLAHLLKCMGMRNVTLQVLPFSQTPAPGPFAMLTFPESDPETVYLETAPPAPDSWVDDRERVVKFRLAWERLRKRATSKTGTLNMIATIAAEYQQPTESREHA